MSVLQGDELENYVNTGFSKQQLASSARPTQHAYSRHNTAIARLVHKVDFSISSFPFPISSFLLLERPPGSGLETASRELVYMSHPCSSAAVAPQPVLKREMADNHRPV